MWAKTLAVLFLAANASAYTINGSLTVTGPSLSVAVSTFAVAAGNVGIGTSAPVKALEVNGAAQFDKAATFPGGANAFSVGTSTLVVTGGNVGIGTSAPATALHVLGSDQAAIIETAHTANGVGKLSPASWLVPLAISGNTLYNYPGIALLDDSNQTGTRSWEIVQGKDDYGLMEFEVGSSSFAVPGTAVMAMTRGGNVGIGTTNPSQLLSVNGTVSLNTNAGTQLYYCAGGTLSQIVIRGSAGAEATACTAGGGTVTALGIYVP
jgi:hypothetical protein